MEYNHNEIEKKWQKYWDENETFKAVTGSTKPSYYVLVEFPYPSGAGLHVRACKKLYSTRCSC